MLCIMDMFQLLREVNKSDRSKRILAQTAILNVSIFVQGWHGCTLLYLLTTVTVIVSAKSTLLRYIMCWSETLCSEWHILPHLC